jgi:hypothetical protein
MSDKAQHELDMEFLRYLEQHAVLHKGDYVFKSDEDKTEFHAKYTDTLNRIRAVYGLTPIQLSKSTLEREPDVPKKKRGRKPKEPTPSPDKTVTFEVTTDHNSEKCVSLTVQPNLEKMISELAKANKLLNKISSIVEAIPH